LLKNRLVDAHTTHTARSYHRIVGNTRSFSGNTSQNSAEIRHIAPLRGVVRKSVAN